MFYCLFGYQRNNKVFGVPAFEMLLLMEGEGKGNESQIAQNCRKGGKDRIYYHYMSDTVFGTL